MLVPQPVARTLRKVAKTGPIEWRAYWRTRPINRHVVLYEAFAGNGMLCNPEALFRALLAAPDQQHLRHVWSLSGLDQYRTVVEEFAADPRVEFVRRGSRGYVKALSTAGFLVNNATFPPDFSKREGQVYLNTWHGTPLKRMGYDEPHRSAASRNVIRNFVSSDYLLSASDFMTGQMYESAYRLNNIFRGRVIEEGLPRTDRQLLTEAGGRELRDRLRTAGVAIDDDQRVVLYAPTWRGESFHAPTNDALTLRDRVRGLQAQLPDNHVVLLKVHQQAYRFVLEHPELRGVLVPNEIPTNVVLGAADVLVTDYSSIFFDFLATGRPIVFFAPDIDAYGSSRGLYLTPDTWPGPVTRSVPELAGTIGAVGTGEPSDPLRSHAQEYRDAVQRFAPHDDGHVSDRVIDIVFRGRPEGRRVRPTTRDGRPTILVYLGGMRPNGITASALNLLDSIDHDRFDVSASYLYSTQPDRQRSAELINARVRSFPRVGSFIPGRRGRRHRRKLLEMGIDASGLDVVAVSSMFHEEWRRCFGDCRFDHIVDFSGYAPFWSFLMLQGKATTHSIWLHNDIRSDQMREVDGRRPNESNLRSVISMYDRFDHLVSVSSALNEINQRKLTGSAAPERFTWARNTINHERIRRLAFGARCGTEPAGAPIQVPRADLPQAVDAILSEFDLDDLETEIERRRTLHRVLRRDPEVTAFVTVGRLSPEKNHERLIRAFDIVHQEHPDTRLVIVGDGPLKSSLHSLARVLGVAEAVTLAGHQDNPFAIMAEADCFVMSSDYEGQPMVALEARVIGLPIVSTDYESVGGVLPDDVGAIVPRTVEGLAKGMLAFLQGLVPNPPFDPVAYNREAVEDFYRAIGAEGEPPA